eukprot:12900792-Prorocentrum_lima.AAC.1
MPGEPRQPNDKHTSDDDEDGNDDWEHPRQYRCIQEETPEEYTADFFRMVAPVQMSSVLLGC